MPEIEAINDTHTTVIPHCISPEEMSTYLRLLLIEQDMEEADAYIEGLNKKYEEQARHC